MEEKIDRKSRITKAQFDMIKITGRISGEVKDILTSEDKSKILQSVENVNNELSALASSMHELSDALNEEVLKEIFMKKK